MSGNITKLTELKKVRFGRISQYMIRIDQQNASLNGATVELNYNFQSDTQIKSTASQTLNSANMQVLMFELGIPQADNNHYENTINIELKLIVKGQVSTIQLEVNRLIYHSDSFNVLMFADFLRAPVYFAIAQNLMEVGLNVTLIINDESTFEEFCDYTKPIPTVVVGKPELAGSYKAIDIFFTDDINIKFGPKGATRVCMPHSLSENETAPFIKSGLAFQHAFLTSDYFLLVTPEQKSFKDLLPILSQSYPLELTQLRHNSINFIPTGYPKIAILRDNLKVSTEKRSLLFAPSSRGLIGITVARTKDICLTLLKAYPDHEIIYRPYPSIKEGQGIEQMVEELSQYSNFTFDYSKSSLASLKRSKYVFTDASSLAVSFSLATETPHFRISVEELSDDNAFIEKEGWVEIGQLQALTSCISSVENNMLYWTDKMKQYENSHTYDVDNVFSNITKTILNILQNKTVEGAIEVKREFKDLSYLNENGFIEHIKNNPFMWVEWQVRPLMISYINSKYGENTQDIVLKLNEELRELIPGEKSTEEMLGLNKP